MDDVSNATAVAEDEARNASFAKALALMEADLSTLKTKLEANGNKSVHEALRIWAQPLASGILENRNASQKERTPLR